MKLLSVFKDFQEIDRAHVVRKLGHEQFHDAFVSETAPICSEW